ncbi:putative SWI/SNF-related matrix-associated actin-dependent regulator of chromatin subfamily A member 3-like 1 [Beta vulgaris subsp. vulgaris]|uniref:putative SWI/SNF-related matrix-associated actin-dependent regulator of chromatin subfamily A member 3-like 1 n=1 Tax=Beta vulgaris subsp. vulgaris TaxID=3555 RepID=UPI0020369CA9|nr:putative SWI/SNF-related matrix-associated actin-dependent regulator of chromatin subfamily A member 3-like 1 [Beta vulgaris subsp. vulgaris]
MGTQRSSKSGLPGYSIDESLTPISQNTVLIATVSLRRTKEKLLIGLPSKSIQTCHVELLHEERELYDRMEEEAKQVVRKYINDGNATLLYLAL